MTERRAHHVDRTPDSLNIGPSHIRWHSGALQFDIQERSAPFGRALRGRVRVEPLIFSDRVQRLDPYGKHLWYPWAPLASIEVNMESPGLNWKGHAYLDGNAGEEPLEAAFTRWDWSRSHSGHGAQIDYDVSRVDGTRSTLSMHIGPDGRCTEQGHPPRQSLRRSGWGIPREAASLHPLKLLRTLEDTPFYARTLLSASTPTGPCLMMHESLSLKRFRRCWVRALLPFRMPRELKGYQST